MRSPNEPCSGSPCDTCCGTGWTVCGRGGMATVFTLQSRYTPIGASCRITCNYTAIALKCTRSSARAQCTRSVHALQCKRSSAHATMHTSCRAQWMRYRARATMHAFQCTTYSARATMHASYATVHTLQCTRCYCNYYGSVPKLYCSQSVASLCSACIVAQLQW